MALESNRLFLENLNKPAVSNSSPFLLWSLLLFVTLTTESTEVTKNKILLYHTTRGYTVPYYRRKRIQHSHPIRFSDNLKKNTNSN